MPIYEYECVSCGYRFEELQEMHAAPLSACPRCKASVRKLPSAATPLSSKGSSGHTCCGKQERCDGSPCSGGGCAQGNCAG